MIKKKRAGRRGKVESKEKGKTREEKKEKKERKKEKKKKKSNESTALRYIKRGGVPFCLSLTVCLFSISSINSYLPTYLTHSFDNKKKGEGGCRSRRALS